jgi:hypothetical protein
LFSRFYSKGNLSRIATALEQAGFGWYAESIRGLKGLESLVKLEVLPSYIDRDNLNQTNPARLEQIRQLEANLLNVIIAGTTSKDVPKISLVIRDNLENTIPMYSIAEQLGIGMRGLRSELADIENQNFSLQLVLEQSKAILRKLQKVKTKHAAGTTSAIVLQFDVAGRSEYLPIEHQIQTAESRVIQLEEDVQDNVKKHKYYEDLLSLNEKLLAQIKSHSSSDYTIHQFQSFLIELTKDVEQPELKDCLNSYIKNIENRIAVNVPVVEEPRIYAVSRGITKKTSVVFVVFLVLTMLGAFLLEGLEKSQARVS